MSSDFSVWKNKYQEGFCVITGLDGFEKQWLLSKGVSLAADWPGTVTFSMSTSYPKDLKLSDNLFGDSYCVISGKIKDSLGKLAGKSKIEFLPVSILNHKGRVASADYFVLNPLDVCDCIDQEKTKIDWNEIDPTVISSVKNLTFKKAEIPGSIGVFRPKYMPDAIFIRRELEEKLAAEGLTGLFFVDQAKYKG